MAGNGVASIGEHCLGKGCGVNCILVEILHHCPGFPTALESDVDWINTSSKECHGSSSSEGSGTNILGQEVQWEAHGADCLSKSSCDLSSSDVANPIGVIVLVKRGIRQGFVGSEVADSSD